MMPADFVKFQLIDYDPQCLYENPLLDVIGEYSISTGEIKERLTAHYNFLKFNVYSNNYITVSGSLHKYWNANNRVVAPIYQLRKKEDKGFNGNDFGLLGIYEVFNDLKYNFGIDIDQTKVLQYEHGLNLNTELNTAKVLNNLILHHGKQPTGKHNGYYKEFEHTKCSLKVYDKGKQYLMDDNVLRIENHYNGSTILKTKGLFTLSDLTKTSVLKTFNNDLLTNWGKTLIYDYTISKKGMTSKEKEQIINYSNPNYWYDLSPTNRNRPKNNLKELTSKYSKKVKSQITDQMEYKSALLTKPCNLIYRHY